MSQLGHARDTWSAATSNHKKFCRVFLWMFLQGFSGVKEIIEPELAGFSTCCARVLSVHQGARRSAAAMRFGQKNEPLLEQLDARPEALCTRRTAPHGGAGQAQHQ